MPETTFPARMKSSTGLALHFMRKGLPRRSWACPAALRGVLKGEGAAATTAPKCTPHDLAEHEAQEKDKRQPAAGLQPKDSQAALSFARASFVRASLEHAQRYGMERPPLSGDVAVTPTQAEAMQPPPPLPPGGP